MAEPKEILKFIAYSLLFLPVCLFLFLLGVVKSAIFSPFVFLVLAFGVTGVVIGLWPCHLFYSIYCVIKTKKFGPCMKCLLIVLSPIPVAAWTVVGVLGSAIMATFYAFVWPVMETFRAVSREGLSFSTKLIKCLTDGTWSNVWGACTIVRDFADFSFHSYFSVTDGLLDSNGEEPIELKVLQIPGCILCAIVGLLIDVIFIPLITFYKSPILLFKGWQRLVQDLVGREGPFLETVCVPFAGLLIVLWPLAVLLAIIAGVLSSIGFGCYAAVIAYREESTKKGLLYAIGSVSFFDEYSNDLLYLREGSCFPRPKYSEKMDDNASLLPVKGLREQADSFYNREPLLRTASQKKTAVNAVLIWDSFFQGCEHAGKELLKKGAITTTDLDAWQQSKNNNKIVNVGIPTCVFLDCLLRSIKTSSTGFILSSNVELTSLNRPEGKVFDLLFDPMSIMKAQLKSLKLEEPEEMYLYKFCLYSGDTTKIQLWDNGGVPPRDEIRRAQLEGIGRRLQGFCLTLSRLPTSRRRFMQVVKEIEQESYQRSTSFGVEGV